MPELPSACDRCRAADTNARGAAAPKGFPAGSTRGRWWSEVVAGVVLVLGWSRSGFDVRLLRCSEAALDAFGEY